MRRLTTTATTSFPVDLPGAPPSGRGRARPLRDRQHPLGLPGLSRRERRQVADANRLAKRAVLLSDAVWRAGGTVILESAADHGDPGRPGYLHQIVDAGYSHAPLWALPVVRRFEETAGARRITFHQCLLGHEHRKLTTLLVTAGAAAHLEALDGRLCNHGYGAHTSARGWDPATGAARTRATSIRNRKAP